MPSFASKDQHNAAAKYFHGCHPILSHSHPWMIRKIKRKWSITWNSKDRWHECSTNLLDIRVCRNSNSLDLLLPDVLDFLVRFPFLFWKIFMKRTTKEQKLISKRNWRYMEIVRSCPLCSHLFPNIKSTFRYIFPTNHLRTYLQLRTKKTSYQMKLFLLILE